MNRKTPLQSFWESGLFADLFSDRERTHTRRINPKLGLLGFLGFLGFMGFLPYILDVEFFTITPIFFFFFAFFGFFGFYYEGKMSDTLIDERFVANMHRATAIANKISLVLIFGVSIFSIALLNLSTFAMLSVLATVIGIAFGLSVFLSQYLLYKYENEE